MTFGHQNHQIGVAFGDIWRLLCTLLGLRDLLGAIWRRNRFSAILRGNLSPHLESLLAPKMSKGRKKTQKNSVQKAVQKKGCSRRSPESAQCVIRTVNTICLERSKSLHLGDFWPHFGSLLGSLLVTFCKKLRFGGIKKRIKKKSENR